MGNQQGRIDEVEVENERFYASKEVASNEEGSDHGFFVITQEENYKLRDQIVTQFLDQETEEGFKSFDGGNPTERDGNERNEANFKTDEERFITLQIKKREEKLKALQEGKLKKKELKRMVKDLLIELDGKNEIICEGKIYLSSLLKEKERLIEVIEEKDEFISAKESAINSLTEKENFYRQQLQSKNEEIITTTRLVDAANSELRNGERKLKDQESLIKDMQEAIDCLTKEKKREAVELSASFGRRLDFEAVTRDKDELQKQLQEKEITLNEKQEKIERICGENIKLKGEIGDKTREVLLKQITIDGLVREKEQFESERRNKELVILELKTSFRQIREENKNLEEQLNEKDFLLNEKERNLQRLETFRRDSTERIENLQSTLRSERQAQQREVARIEGEKRAYQQRLRILQEELQRHQIIGRNLEFECNRARQSVDFYRKDQPWMVEKEEITLSEKVLGTGAWGRVLEGSFRGTKVAVKEIHEVISSTHNRFLFDREITFATLVRHPCLLQFMGVADYGTENPLLITELMDMSLSVLLNRERITAIKYTMIIALDIARGINYLHLFRPVPIIHRDISPGNVMIWRQGDRWRAKVCDFGSAEFQGRDMSVNPGNPFYSAPEASTANQTPKIDVFSFGVLLCEMCTKEPPDPDKRDHQIASVWNKEIRTGLAQCMNKSPDNRPTMDCIIKVIEPMTS